MNHRFHPYQYDIKETKQVEQKRVSAGIPTDPLAGFLPRERFGQLHAQLSDAGYRCVGPQVRDGSVVFTELGDMDNLPKGVIDKQQPGSYTLEETGSPRHFLWANGAQAIKPEVFKPHEPLWKAEKTAHGVQYSGITPTPEKLAIIGVRACDLAALKIQDQHFIETDHPDPAYRARREALLLVAVHCARAADTCFCASTGDGPAVGDGADLVLGETDSGYIVSSHSLSGNLIRQHLDLEAVSDSQWQTLNEEVQSAADQQERSLPAKDLRPLLYQNLEHAHWNEVAERCLSCGNCTSVCPTCFCFHELDESPLDGHETTRSREWDSCFSGDHGKLAGFNIRAETRFRYRQWLVHKLGTWHEQQGRSGCVGCGRCISWCPVGIDLTSEIRELARLCEQGAK